jgi:hypothetical protein
VEKFQPILELLTKTIYEKINKNFRHLAKQQKVKKSVKGQQVPFWNLLPFN